MYWNRALANLRDVLAGLFLTVSDSRRIVQDAGLNPTLIAFDNKPKNNWHNILVEAQKQSKVNSIISVALEEYPNNQWLVLAQQGNLRAVKGPDIEEELTWRGPTSTSKLEKIIGNRSTLLPISFLEVGLMKACSVAKISCSHGNGSGFLTNNNLLITCNHVLPNKSVANNAVVRFNYQKTSAGLDAQTEDFKLRPSTVFYTSKENDWTVVQVEGNANQKWGVLELISRDPKAGDRVSIIQHPGGGQKKIGLYHNVVVFVSNNRLQYLTDTEPGSSGSPVFDNNWQVVALHHSGGWLPEPGSKQKYYRNEGIHVNTMIKGLAAKGIFAYMSK